MSHPTRARLCFASIAAAFMPAILGAQARVIRVVSSDSQPVAYANVIVEGGLTQITDEKGDVSLGAGKRQTLTLNIRRIGFSPWFGKIELPDTAAVLTITLSRLAQTLSAVTITGAEIKSPLAIKGFYDRWLMRQKGVLSAVFISPEELEFRHPDRITAVLYGLNGVRFSQDCIETPTPRHGCLKGQVAFSSQPTKCPMAIVVDGQQQYPPAGAYIDLDRLLGASEVAGIEVYARGGNMPVGFQFQDTRCGVLAFWTGSRKP